MERGGDSHVAGLTVHIAIFYSLESRWLVRTMHRRWPGVPRAGDVVQLDDGSGPDINFRSSATVDEVEWLADGSIYVKTHPHGGEDDELAELRAIGYILLPEGDSPHPPFD